MGHARQLGLILMKLNSNSSCPSDQRQEIITVWRMRVKTKTFSVYA